MKYCPNCGKHLIDKNQKRKINHYLIILDESGSMGCVKDSTISGFNEVVDSIKKNDEKYPNQESYVTLITFNSDITFKLVQNPVSSLIRLNSDSYNPSTMTALYDAMGQGIDKMRKVLDRDNTYADAKCVVTIITDGHENVSKEYTQTQLKSMIDELQTTDKWTFTYVGTSDVLKVAKTFNIYESNIMPFMQTEVGVKKLWGGYGDAIERYTASRSCDEDVRAGFFVDDAENQ
jgi:hypothetical protein